MKFRRISQVFQVFLLKQNEKGVATGQHLHRVVGGNAWKRVPEDLPENPVSPASFPLEASERERDVVATFPWGVEHLRALRVMLVDEVAETSFRDPAPGLRSALAQTEEACTLTVEPLHPG